MRNYFRLPALLIGLATFIAGLMVVSLFTNPFQTRFVPFVLLLGAAALIVFKFRCGGCCSR